MKETDVLVLWKLSTSTQEISLAFSQLRKAIQSATKAIKRLPRSGFEGMVLAYRAQDANWSIKWQRGFWFDWWTPHYHQGRGPYMTIGCGLFAVYRGY